MTSLAREVLTKHLPDQAKKEPAVSVEASSPTAHSAATTKIIPPSTHVRSSSDAPAPVQLHGSQSLRIFDADEKEMSQIAISLRSHSRSPSIDHNTLSSSPKSKSRLKRDVDLSDMDSRSSVEDDRNLSDSPSSSAMQSHSSQGSLPSLTSSTEVAQPSGPLSRSVSSRGYLLSRDQRSVSSTYDPLRFLIFSLFPDLLSLDPRL